MSQGMNSSGQMSQGRTAEKERLKERFDWLESFSDVELSQIAMCSPGDVMKEDDEYFDISHPEQGVMHGSEGQAFEEGNCFVARSRIPEHLWNKLVGPFSDY